MSVLDDPPQAAFLNSLKVYSLVSLDNTFFQKRGHFSGEIHYTDERRILVC